MQNSIILTYHSIIEDGQKPRDFYRVPVSNFRGQVEYLVHSPRSTVHGQVILTFDDGDITNYTNAYPILKELGLSAYFFILLSRVGQDGYMNWGQIKELRNNGMIIGSHGMTHRILIAISDKEIEAELKDSKRILEDNLGVTIRHLSIPRGFYNQKIIQKAKEVGYESVFTSDLGINLDSSFRLKRIAVRNSLSIGRFKRILEGRLMIRETTEEIAKKMLQACIGMENYEKLTLKAYERGKA